MKVWTLESWGESEGRWVHVAYCDLLGAGAAGGGEQNGQEGKCFEKAVKSLMKKIKQTG